MSYMKLENGSLASSNSISNLQADGGTITVLDSHLLMPSKTALKR